MTKTIVGLDFGHGVIRAAEVLPERGRRRATLVRYQEVRVPFDAIREGVVVDEDAVVGALESCGAPPASAPSASCSASAASRC